MANFWKKLKANRRLQTLAIALAVIGPGLVTANADNDAGGITTYASVGAAYGYEMLWGLLLITISLGIVQEMSARMGAVTGKGLSDLIREEFGVKWTFIAMLTLLFSNMATTAAEFAGIAASMEIFGLSRYIAVPAAGIILWLAVVKGSYKQLEKFFLALSLVFATYIISGFLAKPEWPVVFRSLFVPSFRWEPKFVILFIGLIGTTITPWMQFYLQSSVVDKGISAKEYKWERLDVLFGAFVTDFVSFFIIVSTAATLHRHGVLVETAKDAALALKPLAGTYATYLFALGLFGASVLAAAILPLSTAYAICEAFGWESSVDRRLSEAPVFFGLFSFLMLFGMVVVLLPGLSLVKIMLFAQIVCGILVPIIMVFQLKLINNRRLMGDYVNGRVYNAITWVTVGFIVLLTILLLVFSIFPELWK
ncbi:MAG: Nramp family divalent metal transporter [Chitinophagales bacterium]